MASYLMLTCKGGDFRIEDFGFVFSFLALAECNHVRMLLFLLMIGVFCGIVKVGGEKF